MEWTCEDCGWPWPAVMGPPPEEAECDNCGGCLVPARESLEEL